MATLTTCSDCSETEELAPCTICERPVCPRHRSGTGRLKDGYQCAERDCWALFAQRVFPGIRKLADLRARFPNLYFRLDRIDTGRGWDGIIERLSERLEALILQEPEAQRWKYRAVQVKQKLGGLCFYLDEGATPEMAGAIASAERDSAATCEVCGEPGSTGKPRDPGPTLTLCVGHFAEAKAGPAGSAPS